MSTAVEYARQCIGTPFHHQGRRAGVGMDCAGMVAWIYEQLTGRVADIPRTYPEVPSPALMQSVLEAYLLPVESLAAGDVALMQVRGAAVHLGVFTGEHFIHAWKPAHRVILAPWFGVWDQRLHSAWRFPHV